MRVALLTVCRCASRAIEVSGTANDSSESNPQKRLEKTMQTGYPPLVIDAPANEFSFVQSMPRREKSRLRGFFDDVEALREFSKIEGLPFPPVAAAELLKVSRNRIDELIKAGKLRSVTLRGHVYVGEKSLYEFAGTHRKAGRPFKAGNGPVSAACSVLSSAGLIPPRKNNS